VLRRNKPTALAPLLASRRRRWIAATEVTVLVPRWANCQPPPARDRKPACVKGNGIQSREHGHARPAGKIAPAIGAKNGVKSAALPTTV
jgi:hypothetical protein